MSNHPYSETTVARFWAKVNKNGPVPVHCPELGPCWVWTGRTENGYGRVSISDKMYRSHRVSAVLSGMLNDRELSGSVGATGKKLILHKCDNRACVRPEHLFVGDQQANVDDAMRKERRPQCRVNGEATPNHKLTEVSVRMIRELSGKFRQWEIGEAFGVTQSQVGAIVTRRQWKHVP